MPISAMHFEKNRVRLEEKVTPEKARKYVKSPVGVWLDVIKENNEEIQDILRIIFPDYYALIFEDCIEGTRPKIERYKDITFIVLKTLPKRGFEYSQMNIIFGKDFILTIREGKTDLTEVKKFFSLKGKFSFDFVVYKLIDKILNGYTEVLDKVEEDIERYEKIAIERPRPENLSAMMNIKRQLFKMHKRLGIQREIIGILFRGEIKDITQKTSVYLRDAHDDISRLIDLEERHRDTITGLMEVHISSTNAQINEVVKILTVVSTFVAVPTLIASIYGMNFEFMPELAWKYGYIFAVLMMCTSVLITYSFFKKKGWL